MNPDQKGGLFVLTADLNEVLRYLGAEKAPPSLREQTQQISLELSQFLQPKFIYRICDLEFLPESIRLAGTQVLCRGLSAFQMLKECRQAALLACTLGSYFDFSLMTMQARDMSKAVIWDACGSSLVEAGCDAAQSELALRVPGRYLTDRFSPGYGDLPLDIQEDIVRALDASRRLGLHVSQSLLINPVKSVTAIIGISDRPQIARIRGCAFCALRDTCTFRKGGKHCGN